MRGYDVAVHRKVRERVEHMDVSEKLHNVPVPERFLPIVYEALAEAYRGKASAGVDSEPASVSTPDERGVAVTWTKDEVMRAYRESSPAQRITLDYLAGRSGQKVWSRELAHAVYPGDNENEAESRLYGVLGAFGSRVINKYGKTEWFFSASRGGPQDDSLGYMVYSMSARVAAWVQMGSQESE